MILLYWMFPIVSLFFFGKFICFLCLFLYSAVSCFGSFDAMTSFHKLKKRRERNWLLKSVRDVNNLPKLASTRKEINIDLAEANAWKHQRMKKEEEKLRMCVNFFRFGSVNIAA